LEKNGKIARALEAPPRALGLRKFGVITQNILDDFPKFAQILLKFVHILLKSAQICPKKLLRDAVASSASPAPTVLASCFSKYETMLTLYTK